MARPGCLPMTPTPIYLTGDPEAHATTVHDRLLALGCSAPYARRERRHILASAVQVKTVYEASALQRERGQS